MKTVCAGSISANGRVGIHGAEHDLAAVNFVVLGDGHGSLRGAALTNQNDGAQTVVDLLLRERLDLLKRARRVGCQIGPAHEVARELLRFLGEIVKGVVLRVNTTGNTIFDQRFARRVQLFHFLGNHICLLFSYAVMRAASNT